MGAGRVVLLLPRLQDEHTRHLQAYHLRPRCGEAALPKAERENNYRRTRISLHVRYGDTTELRLALPETLERRARAVAAPLAGSAVTDLADLLSRIQQLERLGHPVHIYPDAEEMVNGLLLKKRLDTLVEAIRRDPAAHPLRKSLLKVELLPYQMDGIAFAVGAGRAIIADDMGLGQDHAGHRDRRASCPGGGDLPRARGLSARPSSPSGHQRSSVLPVGQPDWSRAGHASAPTCTRVTRSTRCATTSRCCGDLPSVERARWDLIILDEAQRIKNWQAKTSRVIKGLASPFALALSGTPLENRLDELFSVVQFINARGAGTRVPLLPQASGCR